ncbi:hypothetical protein CEXT_686901 [Caerostris extrusa]|uniref:Uncharacterized protein n=1 Tax=Caerostris extrusa TaxID=172846 RepID=A0AAV4T6F6_CAEEX|nr:hypothetical protein CEXT_686901 [Caerostris extrusa]
MGEILKTQNNGRTSSLGTMRYYTHSACRSVANCAVTCDRSTRFNYAFHLLGKVEEVLCTNSRSLCNASREGAIYETKQLNLSTF